MSTTSYKSVHLTNYYHKNSGGISTSFNNLMAAALRHQRHVRLIVPGEVEAIEDVNAFARIYYVPAKYSPIFDKRYRLILPWQYMLNDSIIRKILLDEMPDFIEVTDKYTLSMLGAMIRIGKFKQIGRPMLVHFSCERMDDNISSFMSKGSFGKWLARRVVGNYLFPNFDFHIANSVYTAEEFYAAVNKSSNIGRSKWFLNKCWSFFRSPRMAITERVYICPRGVDSVMFTPQRSSATIKAEMRQRAGIEQTATVLLYAGRISPEKNIELLPEIMRVLANDKTRDFRLLVAGAGPQADWLKAEGEKVAPGRIVQLGHLDKELLANYYANADVFIHPNPREPFGIAPLEAMASGVPTVAPNAGGILSYATSENAWLMETTGESFATAIREILDNSVLRERKIANALQAARENTREASTDRLFATYDQMLEDFQTRNELFVDKEKAGTFDFNAII